MKTILKPARIAFYFLMLLVFFALGLYFAQYIEAGKGQGLAGGAIVLAYGVVFGGIAFVASFFLANIIPHKTLKRSNWILLMLLLAAWGYKWYEFQERDRLQKERNAPYQSKTTEPLSTHQENFSQPLALANQTSRLFLAKNSIPLQQTDEQSLGYFSPNFFNNPTLYCYGNINLEKSLMDHLPTDSITFKRNQFDQFEIATAPPWLVPEIQKLDYNMLYFKLIGISEDFAIIVGNSNTGQKVYVDRHAGKVIYWPDFLLTINSVEFLPNSKEKVHIKPITASSNVNVDYNFMRVLAVQQDWAHVLLLDDNFEKKGSGWIQWKRDGKLLIQYNLLS